MIVFYTFNWRQALSGLNVSLWFSTSGYVTPFIYNLRDSITFFSCNVFGGMDTSFSMLFILEKNYRKNYLQLIFQPRRCWVASLICNNMQKANLSLNWEAVRLCETQWHWSVFLVFYSGFPSTYVYWSSMLTEFRRAVVGKSSRKKEISNWNPKHINHNQYSIHK